MKNITFFVVLVISICTARQAIAQEGPLYAVSISPQFGFVHGQAKELVYPAGTKAEFLSELRWDKKPVFYYGISLDFSQIAPRDRRGYFFNLSLKQGIPGRSGMHENRDWMSKENANLTHFSRHDNHTRELFFLDFGAGLSFPFDRIILKPFFNLSFMRLSFFGTDGYGLYARQTSTGSFYPIDDNPKRVRFSGKVISYTQEWLNLAPGISAGYYAHDNFLTELSFMISPLVSCVALDEHKERNIQFNDHTWGGIWLEPGFKLSWAITEWLGISGEVSWRHIVGTKGQSYTRTPIGAGSYQASGIAGTGLSVINTSLAVTLRL